VTFTHERYIIAKRAAWIEAKRAAQVKAESQAKMRAIEDAQQTPRAESGGIATRKNRQSWGGGEMVPSSQRGRTRGGCSRY
jgi:hypothetical protein